jgi:hypothetical protein
MAPEFGELLHRQHTGWAQRWITHDLGVAHKTAAEYYDLVQQKGPLMPRQAPAELMGRLNARVRREQPGGAKGGAQ